MARANLKGLTAQQIDLMQEMDRRAEMGLAPQTAWQFEGLPTKSPYGSRRHPISGSAARGTLERLVKRGLVTHVSERPRTYGLTPEGLDAIGV